jgi:hypothetical protein
MEIIVENDNVDEKRFEDYLKRAWRKLNKDI